MLKWYLCHFTFYARFRITDLGVAKSCTELFLKSMLNICPQNLEIFILDGNQLNAFTATASIALIRIIKYKT